MKKQLIITILLIVTLAVVLINLSCNGTVTNNTATNNTTNSSNNANAQIDTESEEDISVPKSPNCDGDSDAKLQKITDGIEENIGKFKKLRDQYDPKDATKRSFHIKVDKVNDDVVLYIWGKVYAPSPNDIRDFNSTFRHYRKNGCLNRIVFKAPPKSISTTSTPGDQPDIGLEFAASCESPNSLCSDGSCKMDCNANTSKGNVNMKPNNNTNSTNSNSNPHTNMNSNVNKKE